MQKKVSTFEVVCITQMSINRDEKTFCKTFPRLLFGILSLSFFWYTDSMQNAKDINPNNSKPNDINPNKI